MWVTRRTDYATRAVLALAIADDALNLDGLSLSRTDAERLLHVDREEWAAEVPEMRAFFDRFGTHLPEEMTRGLEALEQQLQTTAV